MKKYLLILFLTLFIAGCNVQSESGNMGKFTKVNTKEAKELINEKNDLIILDVRTLLEYEAFHIDNATNIDFYSKDFESQLDSFDKNVPYFIYCRSGHRSSITVDIMKNLGFIEVYELTGGILKWN